MNVEHVKATFAERVLEVAVPLPARAEAKPTRVPIEGPAAAAQAAA